MFSNTAHCHVVQESQNSIRINLVMSSDTCCITRDKVQIFLCYSIYVSQLWLFFYSPVDVFDTTNLSNCSVQKTNII